MNKTVPILKLPGLKGKVIQLSALADFRRIFSPQSEKWQVIILAPQDVITLRQVLLFQKAQEVFPGSRIVVGLHNGGVDAEDLFAGLETVDLVCSVPSHRMEDFLKDARPQVYIGPYYSKEHEALLIHMGTIHSNYG